MSKFYKVINRKGEVKRISEFIYNTPRLMARHGYQPIPEPKKAKVPETVTKDDLSEAKIEGVSVFDQEKKVSRWAKPLIKRHDIDISQVTGTGKDGMIMKSDIEHLI